MDPHQLRQDRQKDDDRGRVAGKLREEGDDHSDEQHGQHGRHLLQRVQLPANPRRQPRLLHRGGSKDASSPPSPPTAAPPTPSLGQGGRVRVGHSADNYTLSRTGCLRFREGKSPAQGHIFQPGLQSASPLPELLCTPYSAGPGPKPLDPQIIHLVLQIIHLAVGPLNLTGRGELDPPC